MPKWELGEKRQFGPLTCQSSASKHKQDQLPAFVHKISAAQSERTGVDLLGTGLDLKTLGELSLTIILFFPKKCNQHRSWEQAARVL